MPIYTFRFGLYNSPFETELFDMDPPVSPKSSSVPVTNTYSSITTGEQSSTSLTSTNSSYTQDAIDLRDLLSLPSAGDLILPSKLKALCANHSMKGLLEVNRHLYISFNSLYYRSLPISTLNNLFDSCFTG